ncbi:MAG: hypothetical protein ABIR78_10660 [Ferruginibacter sp.]
MKKIISIAFIFCMAGAMLISCGNKADTPESVAEKWCDLNGKVYRAADGAEKDAAKEARKKYENAMEEKYKSDTAFMHKVGAAVEACEPKSEGK